MQRLKELWEILDQIETFWMQKSRMEAIRDKDRNTQYFRTNTVIRQRFNQFKDLLYPQNKTLATSASNKWRGILENLERVIKVVAVGEGRRTLIRGDHDEWIRGFSENFGMCTSIKEELKAALRGFCMGHLLGLKKIWLQGRTLKGIDMASQWTNENGKACTVDPCKLQRLQNALDHQHQRNNNPWDVAINVFSQPPLFLDLTFSN
ncbi:hypothetical protein Cgig2_019965 [Carnegiea gigantea]|uniref:RNase H type-1 domain-containing protein n=1 Tax=Carnegiea gigantea TaxID=171969 RepID=A0A9Q1Q9W1_9CARY|nr:hypothetical protein Cgig2_019965 [Carnegiea gigantea]